ncbi:DUF4105 domain-containing protein [Photobacterium sp.]|uniref:Lnb N-terminal periplasmic domain-containing protein n=1 Tax=Photobacterium sp. TaxID=660 RepID=UPI00299E8963|nr:DUF4105 domain-containing protein [Photobacterium sp.]MDX1301462.1 DUF4105 domain-containing protein [Photobacterium sp.]
MLKIPSLKQFITSLFIFSAPVLSFEIHAQNNFSQADIETLSKHSYWLKLGHYQPAVLSAWKSQVDSPEFFLSPEGKQSPLSELQATLDKFSGSDYEKYACQYPARFAWLKESLQFEQVTPVCEDFDDWKSTISPQGLTMVFPTAFINNPESMFGHTLLRIDAHNQTKHKELVAYAINFAADPDPSDNPATFALKGFAGSYPGYFSVMPYYRKVREYNDLESRDIWEFPLNLTESEVERIILHLWELQPAIFDYYYMDENCSYQLLSLLQLARDDLNLTDQFTFSAIPSDTISALKDKGLLEDASYRASYGTRLLHFSEQLDKHQLQAAYKAMEGELPEPDQYSDTERAAIIEMAYEWLNFRFYDEADLDRTIAAPRLNQLLIERSKIKVRSPFPPVEVPLISPEESHGSARIGIGAIYNHHAGNKMHLAWRANYHDLLDRSGGFIPGAQISLYDLELSVSESGTSRLEKFHILDVMSLAPDNDIFNSWSWNARGGFDRQPDDSQWKERWFLQGGLGKSWGNPNTIHSYLLASGEINTGDITSQSAELGIGLEGGIVMQVNPNNKIAINTQVLKLIDTEAEHHSKATLSWQWSPARQWGVRSEIGYQMWNGDDAFGKVTGYLYY